MITVEQDKKGTILFVKSKEIVSKEDMLQGLDFLLKNTKLPESIRILEDAIESEVTFTIKDVPSFIEKLRIVSQRFLSIKHAVIHKSPKNTALAMLIDSYNLEPIYKLGVFTTQNAALNWLNE